jgi:dTDP-4-dehydrorhamnose reductase
MRWAVIGNNGQFGSELTNLLLERGESVLGLNRSNLDLEQPVESIARMVSGINVIVNAVGYTRVDQAEFEPDVANQINGNFAGKLALAASIVGAKYFYISSDYVFDGLAGYPYSVHSPTNPLSVYGKSKQLGEQLVAESGCNYTIFRTAWLYGAMGGNFPKTISTRLFKEKSARVVNDQIGTPTWTLDLAQVVYQHGIYNFSEKIVHAVASGFTSWFDFGMEVAQALRPNQAYSLTPVSSGETSPLARRPAFSVLDNSETKGPIIGDWRERWRIAAPTVLAEFLAK